MSIPPDFSENMDIRNTKGTTTTIDDTLGGELKSRSASPQQEACISILNTAMPGVEQETGFLESLW